VPQPISPYGVSKLAADQYCVGLSAVYGIEVAALRFFNVFGSRQDQNMQYIGVTRGDGRWPAPKRPARRGIPPRRCALSEASLSSGDGASSKLTFGPRVP